MAVKDEGDLPARENAENIETHAAVTLAESATDSRSQRATSMWSRKVLALASATAAVPDDARQDFGRRVDDQWVAPQPGTQ